MATLFTQLLLLVGCGAIFGIFSIAVGVREKIRLDHHRCGLLVVMAFVMPFPMTALLGLLAEATGFVGTVQPTRLLGQIALVSLCYVWPPAMFSVAVLNYPSAPSVRRAFWLVGGLTLMAIDILISTAVVGLLLLCLFGFSPGMFD